MNADRLRATLGAAALLAATVPWLAAPAHAVTQSLALSPAGAVVMLRAYALGLMPIDGSFARFQGRIDFDPAQPSRCKVELVAETASLQFTDASMRAEVLSPSFLDAAAYPTLAYRGECAPRALQGQLTLHGQTHPFTLALTGDAAHLVATGTIDRTAWGITGRRFTVGASVRIQMSVSLPEATRGVLPGLLTGPAR